MSASPAAGAVAVTPSDTGNIPSGTCRALYIGGPAGGQYADVVVMPAGYSASVTFKNVPVGSILPVNATRVLATGTTATFIVALY